MERYADSQDEEVSGKNSIAIIGHRCENRCPIFCGECGIGGVCGRGDNCGNGRGKQCKDALNVCAQSFAGREIIQAHTAPHPTGELGSIRCFGNDGWNENVGGDDPSVLTADKV